MKTTLFFIIWIAACIEIYAQQPHIEWAKNFGGNSDIESESMAVAVDAEGNVYTTGYFVKTIDFDPGEERHELTAIGKDIFISKLDPKGNFVWVKQIGGKGYQTSYLIRIDKSGNIYIVGEIDNNIVDLDPGTNVFNSPINKSNFVLKLDHEGDFIWARPIVSDEIHITSIAIDASEKIYLTGKFYDTTNFNPTSEPYYLTATEYGDAFIIKLNSLGKFEWVKQIGGGKNSDAIGLSITYDNKGNVYITGSFSSTVDFNPGLETYNLSSSPAYNPNVFIVKLDSNGNLLWAKRLDSRGDPSGNTIAVDKSGNIYKVGLFSKEIHLDSFTLKTDNNTGLGFLNVYLMKSDSSGKVMWAKKLGGVGGALSYSIQLDESGNVYTSGIFKGEADFDPGKEAFIMTSTFKDSAEIFILKLDNDGELVWAKNLYGASVKDLTSEGAIYFENNVILGVSGSLYLSSAFRKTIDLDPSTNISTLHSHGYSDIFIVKLNQNITDIHQPGANNTISISHSSSFNTITVSFSKSITNGMIKLVNLLGQTVFEQTNVNGTSTTLNIADQPSGTYFLEMKENGIISRVKFVKE